MGARWQGTAIGLVATALGLGCGASHPRGGGKPAMTAGKAVVAKPTPLPETEPIPPVSSEGTATTTAEPVPATTPQAAPEQFRGQPMAELLRAMAEEAVVKLKKRYPRIEPVYKLELVGGLTIAFKPQTVGRPMLWKNDLISWELARQLGLGDRLPPVTTRWVKVKLLPDPTEVLVPAKNGMVFGTAIFWMPVLKSTGLTGPTAREKWSQWTRLRTPLPPESSALAEQLSALVVFDYLQANTDRYDNDENLMADENGRLVYRDNNESWTVAGMTSLATNGSILRLVERFPRGLVAALRKTDGHALEAALARWGSGGHPLLDQAHLDLYDARRRFVLTYIDDLIKHHGEDAVLAWP